MAVVLSTLVSCGVSSPPPGVYKIDPVWPAADMPTEASAFSAVAVDHVAKEVHVIQRGPLMPPLLVFDESGKLIRTYGNGTITFANGTWGSHGLNIRYPPFGRAPQLWVFDFFAGKILLFSPQGELLSTAGSSQGTATSPLQYGNVADGGFDAAGGLAVVADGDGGVNDRVVGLDATMDDLNSPAALKWISGNAPSDEPKRAGDPGCVPAAALLSAPSPRWCWRQQKGF